jgi:hypothetical protein
VVVTVGRYESFERLLPLYAVSEILIDRQRNNCLGINNNR